jgi:hypothetical protein
MASFGLIRRSIRGGTSGAAWWAGAFAGYAVLTRLDSLVALPGIAVFLALAHAGAADDANATAPRGLGAWLARTARCQLTAAALRRWLAWGAPILAALAVHAILNWRHFGTLAPAYVDQPEGVQFATPLLVGLHGYLCSIGRGLFFFSPPLFLFFWSIRGFTRREPPLGWGLIVSIVLSLGVMSTWINWAGGWDWGPRHIFMIHWMLALPICDLLRAPRRMGRRLAYGALVAVGVAVQVYGASVSPTKFYRAHYTDALNEPRAMALYRPDDEPYLRHFYRIQFLDMRSGEFREPAQYSSALVAPQNDSVYIYQNSQWPGNARCLAHGWHDFYWLHLMGDLKRAARPEEATNGRE